jgi:uncharacterized FlaG/YvyC family protein
MASDGIPVNVPITRLVHGSQAQASETVKSESGSALPRSGENSPAKAVVGASPVRKKPDAEALVSQLNKPLNESGRPDQFRLDTSAGRNVIQQVDPNTGEVVAEYSEAEFPMLAQGLSGAGRLVDTRA